MEDGFVGAWKAVLLRSTASKIVQSFIWIIFIS